jgi:subtilisin family serine protease
MKKINYLLLVFLANLFLFSCSKDEQLKELDATVNETVTLKSSSLLTNLKMVPNEILVKFKDGTNTLRKGAIYAQLSGVLKENILTKAMKELGDKNGIDLVTISGNISNLITLAKNITEIEYAEPNYIYHHCATSNDPYFTNGSLWGMYGSATTPKNQYGSNASAAWKSGHVGSSSVYVGVIDEGYMYTHEDLAANVGTNPNEIPGDNIDNDGNGYVDDVYGWDFANNDATIFDGTSADEIDHHGTHVAGTIGAVGGNGIGVAGVCWNVKLLSGKFLGEDGGTTANAVKAIDYFVNLKKAGVNIVALNNSWGGGSFSSSLYNAILRAKNADILFVVAAGNDGTNNDIFSSYPGNYSVSTWYWGKTYAGLSNMIVVAAINSSGSLASWSQYGKKSVTIGAPGVDIWSTLPNYGYGSYSGTSMATPHVTGACALYKSNNPSASATVIKNAIINSAVSTTSLKNKCVTGGRLNVGNF